MTIQADIQSLSPTALIELFALDLSKWSQAPIYFHAGTNGLVQNVVWQGTTYLPMPIEAEGFDVSSKGTLPRPKFRVANVNGVMSGEVMTYDDLVGATVTRKRTFAKYLDAANFPAKRNLLVYSNDIGGTGWTNEAYTGTLTLNYGIAPDGSLASTYYNWASGYSYQLETLTPGATYTWSCWVKGTPAPGKGIGIWSYLAAGIIATSSQAINASSWTRCSVTFTAPASGNCNTMVAGAPVGIFKNVEVWGAQLDLGAVMTDYQAIGSVYQQNPNADPNQHMNDEIWFVEQKVNETRYSIEWELSSAFDLQGVKLPLRQVIQNACSWVYKSAECGYAGTNYFDATDTACAIGSDFCAKRLSSCAARFPNTIVPFGGFPGARRSG